MEEVKIISWKSLTGNKFSKTIDTAMMSKAGYVAQQSIRQTGTPAKAVFNVIYDQEYLLRFVVRKFIKPLSALGKERIVKIIDEAWALYDKESRDFSGLS